MAKESMTLVKGPGLGKGASGVGRTEAPTTKKGLMETITEITFEQSSLRRNHKSKKQEAKRLGYILRGSKTYQDRKQANEEAKECDKAIDTLDNEIKGLLRHAKKNGINLTSELKQLKSLED